MLHPPPLKCNDQLDRFNRSICLASHFCDKEDLPNMYNPKIYIPSNWDPPTAAEEIKDELHKFNTHIKLLFRTHAPPCCSNLTGPQQQLLRHVTKLKIDSRFIITTTDQNLGPMIIEHSAYLHKAFTNHLSHADTYVQLPTEEACWVRYN